MGRKWFTQTYHEMQGQDILYSDKGCQFFAKRTVGVQKMGTRQLALRSGYFLIDKFGGSFSKLFFEALGKIRGGFEADSISRIRNAMASR